MSGTTVTYGQIVLENCQTEQFIQSCKYDPSQTDLLYHEYTITVSTVVYGNAIGKTLGPTNIAGTTPTSVQEYLRAYLTHPRGAFTYSTNGDLLLAVSAANDVANGPQPVDLQITHVSAAAFHIRWTIKLAVVQCPVGGFVIDPQTGQQVPVALDIPEVLNHRWNYEETVDDNWYRRRVWNGTIRVRNMATPPQLYRNLCIPPLARGYKRESMRFTQEPNGLVGAYQIVDVSIDAAAPKPATSWGGSHVRQLGIDGIKQNVDIHVWMKGPPGVDKIQLFARCLQVTTSRIGTIKDDLTLADNADVKAIIESASLVEHMGEDGSRVETHLRVMLTPNPNAKTAFGVNAMNFGGAPGVIPDYDRFTATPLPPYDPGTPVGSIFTYFQSPCGGPKGFPQFPEQQTQGQNPDIDQNSPIQQGAENRPQPQTDVSPSLPQDPKPTSASQTQTQTTFYQSYQIASTYALVGGKVGFPLIAKKATGEASVYLQRHAPITHRVVEMIAERFNAPVEVPTPEAAEGEELLEHSVAPEAPQLAPDGVNIIYRARWRGRYGRVKHLEYQDVLKMGTPPTIDPQKLPAPPTYESTHNSGIVEVN